MGRKCGTISVVLGISQECLQRGETRDWMGGSAWAEHQQEDLPSTSMVQIAFSWADKASRCSAGSVFSDASVTPNMYISFRADPPWPWGQYVRWYICWTSLFNIHTANKKLFTSFKAKGSGLAIVCWKMMSAHPRRRHHFRNFQLVHIPPPS